MMKNQFILCLGVFISLLGCKPNYQYEISNSNINSGNLVIHNQPAPVQTMQNEAIKVNMNQLLHEISYPIFEIKTALEQKSYGNKHFENMEIIVDLDNQHIQDLTRFLGKEIVKSTLNDFNLAMYSILNNKSKITYDYVLYSDIADSWLNLNPLTCALTTSYASNMNGNIDCFYEVHENKYFYIAKITIEKVKENNQALIKVVFNQPTLENLTQSIYDYNYIVDKIKSMPNTNNFYRYGILQDSEDSGPQKIRKRHTYSKTIYATLHPLKQLPE